MPDVVPHVWELKGRVDAWTNRHPGLKRETGREVGPARPSRTLCALPKESTRASTPAGALLRDALRQTAAPVPPISLDSQEVGSGQRPQPPTGFVATGYENSRLHQLREAPGQILSPAPAVAASSSESTSPPADFPEAACPSRCRHSYKSKTPSHPHASSAPCARWEHHPPLPSPTKLHWHHSARSAQPPASSR